MIFLKNLFLKWDPMVSAFDQFYEELFQSESYSQLQMELGLKTISYNLINSHEENLLENWLRQQNGTLLDYGCGLSLPSQLLQPWGPLPVKIEGLDFSQKAISYCLKNFPEHSYRQEHLSLHLRKKYHCVFIGDSLYHHKRPQRALKSLLKNATKSLFLTQLSRSPETFYLRGAPDPIILDVSEKFRESLEVRSLFLESSIVKAEGEIFPTLWDTIRREIAIHLEKIQRKEVRRYVVTYNF